MENVYKNREEYPRVKKGDILVFGKPESKDDTRDMFCVVEDPVFQKKIDRRVCAPGYLPDEDEYFLLLYLAGLSEDGTLSPVHSHATLRWKEGEDAGFSVYNSAPPLPASTPGPELRSLAYMMDSICHHTLSKPYKDIDVTPVIKGDRVQVWIDGDHCFSRGDTKNEAGVLINKMFDAGVLDPNDITGVGHDKNGAIFFQTGPRIQNPDVVYQEASAIFSKTKKDGRSAYLSISATSINREKLEEAFIKVLQPGRVDGAPVMFCLLEDRKQLKEAFDRAKRIKPLSLSDARQEGLALDFSRRASTAYKDIVQAVANENLVEKIGPEAVAAVIKSACGFTL